ncbi:peptide chain release factor N(5)-glutamine methyltransferase [Serratia symbiotica]|uniref:peptide chain release factor N(5)-glutamine methyltransferase n=1 Tax=Serratia symbiotica TaxID=138074 RepID=UPI0030D5FB86|nr:peptide chain release factor N(5)-glutamine methyltransferase [Serratia symbiotica]
MDYHHWLKAAAARLTHSDSPRRDAEILLGFITGRARAFLLAFDETRLTPQQQQQLEALLVRREQGEPVAYLVGEREFWSLPLSVSPATLIPRLDSECLVALALERLPIASCHILDLGTGTGAIALALASERPDCTVIGVDVQPDALALAQHNAQKLTISNVQFLQGNWFSSLAPQHFALIASNPPYIDADDAHLMQGDVRFEPANALVAAQQGLADLDAIVRQAPQHLQPQGWLLLEHGWQQGRSVRALMLAAGFRAVATYRDYGHNERVTLGQWPSALTKN